MTNKLSDYSKRDFDNLFQRISDSNLNRSDSALLIKLLKDSFPYIMAETLAPDFDSLLDLKALDLDLKSLDLNLKDLE